ncbi:MAG: amidophosphoribosyltransferase [Candidatus Omnitrophica bacterium]|nr:amidophosphoribosyltransferase [Candidatus Omnitrophota bacterium]
MSEDGIKEYCGLFGISHHPEAARLTYLGLYALQHRGEESAGIVSTDGEIMFAYKGMGLVSEVFDEEKIKKLKGSAAIGHVRYSTTGSSLLRNAQPILVDCAGYRVAIGHNGNLTNAAELRRQLEEKGALFQTTTDSEIIVHLLAHEAGTSFEDRIMSSLIKAKGAFSLVLMTQDLLIGVRDPYGFRPLALGQFDGAYVLASESCAFDLIGAKFIRELEPGEVLFIDGKKKMKSLMLPRLSPARDAACIFELIYFARPDSTIFGWSVQRFREELGSRLAKEHPAGADLVIAVPDSGNSAALGYSRTSGIPFEIGMIRNHYIGRTFIQPTQDLRDFKVRVKLNPVRQIIEGKRVVVVDDSIVRGTTSKMRVHALKQAGAKEVHMRISCPPIKFPCPYGIDFPTSEELIASNRKVEDIRKFLGADSLGYLSMEGLLDVAKNHHDKFCSACFSGDYAVSFDENAMRRSKDKPRNVYYFEE